MTSAPELNPDELAELIDSLFAAGSQHINLNIGEETRVQTVSSTECNPNIGPCAVPNAAYPDTDEEE